MIVEPTIHSFSLRQHFAYKSGFGVIEFVKLARSLGFQGLSLSLNDANYRHLGGKRYRSNGSPACASGIA